MNRIGLLPLKVEKIAEGVIPPPPGRPISTMGPGARRRISAMRPTAPALKWDSADRTGPGFSITGPLKWEEHLAFAWELLGYLAKLAIAGGELADLAAIELDQLRKFGWQRGTKPYADIHPEGFVAARVPRDRFKGLSSEMELFLGWDRLPKDPIPTGYPLGTNGGPPTYSASGGAFGLDILLAVAYGTGAAGHLPLLDDISETFGEVASSMGEVPFLHSIPGSRARLMKKPVELWEPAEGGLGIRKTDVVTSGVVEQRMVHMFPRALNMRLQPTVTRIKTWIRTHEMFDHHSHGHTALKLTRARRELEKRSRVYEFSDDISRYDSSVSVSAQEELAGTLARIDPGYATAWADLVNIEVLCGAHGLGEGYAYRKDGMTSSGMLPTSTDGCLLNGHRVLKSVGAAFGRDAAWARKTYGTHWYALLWGDDTALLVTEGFNPSAYQEASAELGYETKMVKGLVFLMKFFRFDAGSGEYQWFPLISRILQQTLAGEYAPGDPMLDVLALASRTENAHHHPLWPMVVTHLSAASPVFAAILSDHRIASRIVRDPATIAALRALAPPIRAAWERDVLGRADRSDSSLVALLARAFGDPDTRTGVMAMLEIERAARDRSVVTEARRQLRRVASMWRERPSTAESTIRQAVSQIPQWSSSSLQSLA